MAKTPTPVPTPAPTPAPTPTVAPPVPAPVAAADTNETRKRAPVVVGDVRTDILPPAAAPKTNRGSKSAFPFDRLTVVNASFHVKDRTAKSISSIVSHQNRKNEKAVVPLKNDDGSLKMKTIEVKDASGAVIGTSTSATEAEMSKPAIYKAYDAAQDDPEGAGARVFLIQAAG